MDFYSLSGLRLRDCGLIGRRGFPVASMYRVADGACLLEEVIIVLSFILTDSNDVTPIVNTVHLNEQVLVLKVAVETWMTSLLRSCRLHCSQLRSRSPL